MYFPIEKLAAGCAIVSTVSAFYPYELSDSDSTTSRARRAPIRLPFADSPTVTSRRSITLPLHLHRRENKFDIINSNDPTQKNSVAVDQDKSDISYMAAVTIGDSKEEYKLLLDSAASNSWIMSEDCKTEACGKHNTFGKSDSSTLKTDPKPFSITYGTGTVSGTTATDTFHIGNSLNTSMTFGLATNVSSEFATFSMDGIIGMGRGSASSPQIVEVLAAAKLIPAKLYGLHLGRAKDGKNDGELNLGEVNKNRFDGDLNWLAAPASDRGFWEVAIADAGVGSTMLGTQGKSGIIDTGTSYFFMPEADAIAIHKLVPGSTQSGENFKVPCSTTQPITFKFGSTAYNMSSVDWVGDKADDGLCFSKIIGRQTFGANEWLVGDAFLKNVYTVFDFDNSRIGFGVKSSASASSSSSSSPSPTSMANPSGSPSRSPSGMSTTSTTSPPPASKTPSVPLLPPVTRQTSSSGPQSSSGNPSNTQGATVAGASEPANASSAGPKTTVPWALAVALSGVFTLFV